ILYLVAPSGYPNYGDELIADTWLRYLARVRPRARVILDCHSPGQAALLLRGAHPRVEFTDTLWQLSLHAPEENADAPWEWVCRAVTDLGVAPRLGFGVEVLHQASTIHFLGGGYVNSVWPQHVSLFAAGAAVGRRTGARVVATGQGLIPLPDGPAGDVVRRAAQEFTVFDVRDEASARAVPGRVRHSGDDAWLALHRGAAQRYRPAGQPDPDGVVLCLQSDLTESFRGPAAAGVAALADLVRDTLDAWAVPGDRVTVVEGIPGHDYEVPHRLGDRLDGATVLPFVDVWRRGLPAGAGQTWISTRFHPHLMAAAAGDPGIAIAAMPGYYSTKHRSLADAGSAWTLVDDGREIPDRPVAGGFAPGSVDRAVAAKRAIAGEIYPFTPSRSLRRP
ncbi:MAG: polysaccharide pyruvyl transferase family protein, partial [Gordonia sp. (in: high G+C Gram-positive bacteria)]